VTPRAVVQFKYYYLLNVHDDDDDDDYHNASQVQVSNCSIPKVMAQSLLSSTLQSIANYFKPYRAEALQRIRVNAFCFILVVVLSNLLPLPSLQSALLSVTSSRHERWSLDWVYRWFCILGMCKHFHNFTVFNL
jgi:hypothetical protein